MKKLVALLLAAMMVFSLVACGETKKDKDSEKPNTEVKNEQTVEVKDATDLLAQVWNQFGEENQFFAFGGLGEQPVENAPGELDLATAEIIESQFCIPADVLAMVDDGASLMHGMNANTFSVSAYHLKDKENLQTAVNGIKERTMSNQWMCGFPEKLVIISVADEYVVSAFGATEIVDMFKEKLEATYDGSATVVVEELF